MYIYICIYIYVQPPLVTRFVGSGPPHFGKVCAKVQSRYEAEAKQKLSRKSRAKQNISMRQARTGRYQ